MNFLITVHDYLSTNLAGLNRLDRSILKWHPYFMSQARLALAGLEAALQSETEPNTILPQGFCHNDPAPRNIIIKDGIWHLIDLELSGIDPYLKDYATLLERALHLNQWQPVVRELIEASYTQVRPLSMIELRILPYLCCFPRRFWRICQQRFQARLPWSESRYASRFWELTNARAGPLQDAAIMAIRMQSA